MSEETITEWNGTIAEGAPESVQTIMDAKKWDNVEQFAKGYAELEQFKGIGDENHLALPEGDDAEAWGKVFNRLGRPEEPGGYVLNYEGDVKLDDKMLSDYKEFAHKIGQSQKQFDQTVNFQIDALSAMAEIMEKQKTTDHNAAIEANVIALKEKFGNGYEAGVQSARAVADKLGIMKTLEAKGLASDVDIVEMLLNIDKRAGEDVIIPGDGGAGQQSPEDERDELTAKDSFTDKFHTDHKKDYERYLELCTIIGNNKDRQG